jgi:hypothetical protein
MGSFDASLVFHPELCGFSEKIIEGISDNYNSVSSPALAWQISQ